MDANDLVHDQAEQEPEPAPGPEPPPVDEDLIGDLSEGLDPAHLPKFEETY